MPGLKGNATRRWQRNPHLKCSLEHVDKILDYLRKVEIDMYCLSSDLLRFAPDVAARFGIYPDDAEELLAQDKALEQGVSAGEEADVDEGELAAA